MYFDTDAPTDSDLDLLRTQPKHRVSATRPKEKGQHVERQFECVSDVDEDLGFRVFVRHSQRSPRLIFSVGLTVHLRVRELVLCRYNGPWHPHTNHLERERLTATYHVHRATARYIAAGMDPDGFAEASNRFDSWESALRCLAHDCKISGVVPDAVEDGTEGLFGHE